MQVMTARVSVTPILDFPLNLPHPAVSDLRSIFHVYPENVEYRLLNVLSAVLSNLAYLKNDN